MSQTVETTVPTVPARRRLHERGMATVEYAIGIVLILVIVGVMIASIQGGWFDDVVEELVRALANLVRDQFKIPVPVPGR